MTNLRSIRLRRLPNRLLRSVIRWVAERGAHGRWWAKVHYGLLCSKYDRDQRSFLAGRAAYARFLDAPVGSMTLLRRNIHRLEKGLLMRPLRTPFAVEYIGETIDAYGVALASLVDSGELAWARDVLGEFFRVHQHEPSMAALYERFQQSPVIAASPQQMTPYKRQLAQAMPIDFDMLMQLARHRRSVRWYLQKPVPRDAIDRAIELATQAPTACNRQPYEFRIFDQPQLVQEIISIPYGTAGFGHTVPVVAVVVGKLRNFFDERDRHLIYIDSSLAVMGLLYGLEVQGISTCCINWPDIAEKEAKLSALLQLDADERPVMLVAMGYADPDGLVANSSKKSITHVRKYNFE